MIDKEIEMLEQINTKIGHASLVASKYNSYDAVSDNYIIEFKYRDKYYATKMIEASKLYINYQQAQLKNRQFLYVVKDPEGMFVFNISKLIHKEINYLPVPMSCPKNTEFRKSSKIIKWTYMLPDSMAVQI